MNKKQIETIAKQYVTFTIETNLYKSPPLNSDKIGFVFDGVMVIKEEKDVFIQTKDVRVIRGVRLWEYKLTDLK